MSNGTGKIGSRTGIGPSVLSRSVGDRQFVSVTDVLSEGPIEGLVNGTNSVFLNNDTLDDIDSTPKSLSRAEMVLRLTKGSKDGSVINANLTSPFPDLSDSEIMDDNNGEMYVLVRNSYGAGIVTATNNRSPGPGDRRYILLSSSSTYFVDSMRTRIRTNYGRYSPTEDEKRDRKNSNNIATIAIIAGIIGVVVGAVVALLVG